jgi:hypothetical protein
MGIIFLDEGNEGEEKFSISISGADCTKIK